MKNKFLLIQAAFLILLGVSWRAGAMEDTSKDSAESFFKDILELAQKGDFTSVRFESLLLSGLEFSRLCMAYRDLPSNARALIGSVLVEYGLPVEPDLVNIHKPILRALILCQEEEALELLETVWKSLDHQEQIRLFRIAAGQGLKEVVLKVLELLYVEEDNSVLHIALFQGLKSAIVSGNNEMIDLIFEQIIVHTQNILRVKPALTYGALIRRDSLFQEALRFAVMQGNVGLVRYITDEAIENDVVLTVQPLREALENLMRVSVLEDAQTASSSRLSGDLIKRYHEIIELLIEFVKKKSEIRQKYVGEACIIT